MKKYCKNKNWEINKEYNVDKLLYLLIDRPNHIIFYNDFVWKNEVGQHHRDYNFPAYVDFEGYVAWWKNDNFHRENNKPAIIFHNGLKLYYINGKFVKEEK